MPRARVTWDHGYAETVYSAQSKTYDRVYVLAPVKSGLVNGQNYYTAITHARFGVKLWTEDVRQLGERLARNSGQKTSALEGLGRLDRDSAKAITERNPDALRAARQQQERMRQERRDRGIERRLHRAQSSRHPAAQLADRFLPVAEAMDRVLRAVLERSPPMKRDTEREKPILQPEPSRGRDR